MRFAMRRLLTICLFCTMTIATIAQRQLFFYCPDARQGFHVAAVNDDDGAWHEVGKLFDSDYGPWGEEKRMYNPYILRCSRV